MTAPFRVAVIGGGLSGLSFAHRLSELAASERAVEISVFEKSARFGGVIETEARDGFLLEKGPDAFLSEKPEALALCRRLGIGSEIIETQAANRQSFIVRGGKLLAVPKGFYLTAPLRVAPFLASPLFSWRGKIRMLFEPFVPRLDTQEETIAQFVIRRYGREALERAAQPMLAGIYTGDPDTLSLDATMPHWRACEKKEGSVTRGLRRLVASRQAQGPRYSLFLSFRKGMQTLTRALESRLEGKLFSGAEVSGLSQDSAGFWNVSVDGRARVFDAVAIALPPRPAAALLSGVSAKISELLLSLRRESTATVNFAYRASQISHALNGFGFVVPKTENDALIACSFSSRKFEHRAPSEGVLLRAFVGGAFGEVTYSLHDAALIDAAERSVARLLGISGKPLFASLSRYPEAMVQYGIGHAALCRSVWMEAQTFRGLALTGNIYRGVGIPDCIADAEEKAEALFKTFQTRGSE